jgi:hypothetical protein
MDPAFRRSEPIDAPVPITATRITDPGHLLSLLKDKVGAHQSISCDGRWVPNRDSVDACLVAYTLEPERSPAKWPLDPAASACRASTPSAFPDLTVGKNGAPCADADGDGLPDAWEARVLEKRCKQDSTGECGPNGTKACGNRWTNLECYLNGMR